jgi:hypothetical protein
MSFAIFAGPAVALIGVVAVFFILRRKSVDKRSMYSARRSQIEHKVRAARQRTLAPHGHAEKPAEAPPGAAPTATYEPAAYEPPPSVPPPPVTAPEGPPGESPWGPTPPAPGPSPFGGQPSEPEPFQPAPYQPAPPEPAPYQPEPVPYQPPAAEPAWTPAPVPSETATPIEPAQPVVATPAGASWSIVGEGKDMSVSAEPKAKRKDKKGAGAGSWQLASGEAPSTEADEVFTGPNAAIAIAQYAILVVGLVMVLIGVLVMIANSHSG